jgi:hypothetical protein
VFNHHVGANSCAENPSPESHPGQTDGRTDATLKKNIIKMKFKLKINFKRECMKLRSIHLNHLQFSPISIDYPFKFQLWIAVEKKYFLEVLTYCTFYWAILNKL